MRASLSLTTAVSGAALLLSAASPLHAQGFPSLAGIEFRAGVAFPEEASTGFSGSLDLDLGFLRTPRLRTVLGFNYFRADVDRRSGADRVGGSLSAPGGRAALRFEPLGVAGIRPFIGAGLSGHVVSADVPDADIQQLLEGFYVGAVLSGGFIVALDSARRVSATAEARRVFITNVSHSALEVGIRYTPRGDAMYTDEGAGRRRSSEEDRLRAEEARREADRLARERIAEIERYERERIAGERAVQQQQRQVEREEEQRYAAAARARYQALLDLTSEVASVTEIREIDRGLVIVVGEGLFTPERDQLSLLPRQQVGRIARALARYEANPISVEVHTDAAGGAAAARRLSERRAEAIRAALIEEGLDPGRIQTAGHGDTRPVADGATEEGRARNRRVEIVIVGARRPIAGS